MKINVSVDLADMFYEDSETIDEWIRDIIKSEIKTQMKKLPEYKAYIKKATEDAVKKLSI